MAAGRPPGIQIRRAITDDAAAFVRLMADEAVFGNLLQLPYPTEEVWRKRLGAEGTPPGTDLHLVAALDGEVVGSAGIMAAGLSPRRLHARTLGISVAVGQHRRGVGSALMAALCDAADRWLNVRRIELTVFTDNVAAQALYRRFGFVEEGLHRGFAFRDGRYQDVLAMARWCSEPGLDAVPVPAD